MAEDAKRVKIAVMGSSVMTLGFRFAGIKNVVNSYPDDSTEIIEKSLSDAIANPEIGIVVIANSVLKQVRDRKLRLLIENSVLPVVIAVPDYRETTSAEDSLRSLIKRAIGIDIAVQRPRAYQPRT